MILIEEIISQPNNVAHKQADYFEIEWYEAVKTTIRRRTKNGREVAVRKNNRIPLNDGDILWQDEEAYIQVIIKPCACIVFQPKNMMDMGIICFEIGNQHIPISIDDDDTISVAYEGPLYSLLEKYGYQPSIIEKKLLNTHFFRRHQLPSQQ